MKIPKREDGQGLVEYALVLVLVAIVIIAILSILGTQVMVVFARVVAGLNGQTITGVGKEAVITSYEAEVTGGLSCTATITDINFIGLENGAIVKNDTVPIVFTIGGTRVSEDGTTGANGLGVFAGPISRTGSSCSIKPGG